METKKKGSVMILAIAVISMLIILAVSVLTVTTSTRIATINANNSNDLKTLVQTGADYGLAILKESIVNKIRPNPGSGSIYVSVPDSVQSGTGIGIYSNKAYDINTIINDIGLNPVNQINDTNFPDNLFTSYPVSYNKYSVSFNILSGTATDPDLIKAGDCYIQYIDLNSTQGIKDLNDDINNKKCIEMRVVAVGKVGNGDSTLSFKSIDTFIDKSSISNYFLDKLINNTITSINDNKYSSSDFSTVTVPSGDNFNVSIDGDIFFKGKSLTITANSNFNLTGVIKARVGDTTKTIDNAAVAAKYQPTAIKYFEALPDGMTAPDATNVSDVGTVVNNDNYQILDDPQSGNPFMLVAKCKPSSGAVDFNQLIFGNGPTSNSDPTDYGYLSNTNGIRHFIQNNTLFNYHNNLDYAKFFKLIIVYGDLDIDSKSLYFDSTLADDPSTVTPSSNPEYFNQIIATNYLIVCLGKVTIKGTLKLENSSIFAKQIEFQSGTDKDTNYDATSTPDYPVVDKNVTANSSIEIDGIGKTNSNKVMSDQFANYVYSWPDNAWGYFTDSKTQILNEYLIKNLPIQYALGLNFNILAWKEN